MSKREYYKLLSEAELALLTVRKALDFDIEGLLEKCWNEGQQSTLRALKPYCKDGVLKESFLDALIKPDEASND